MSRTVKTMGSFCRYLVVKRKGSVFTDETNADRVLVGCPSSSIDATRLNSSAKKIPISNRAKCWPRQM
jgi:hypothetical protein